MRRTLAAALLLGCVGLLATSCGGGGSAENSLYPGQTDFVNNEPGDSHDSRYGGYGPPMAGAEGDATNKATPSPTTPGAPQGRTGEVEEADIYKVEGNTLYYLNTYRGFIIYDMADAKKPVMVSRLPVYGYPIEMFVSKGTVYALLRDVLYLSQTASGQLQFKRHNTSQLVAIDISDPKSPKVLKTVDIIGQLREGVSRKIEDTIYVVSYQDRYYYYDWSYNYSQNDQKEQAWVYSFNVADPKSPQLVDQIKVFEGGGYSYHDPNYNASVSRYFQDVTISATSNALMVVENWYTYGWVSGSKWNCGSSTNQQQAIVSLIDISDPKGKIRLHTKFETYGEIGDQFKQTYNFDEKTGKATYLGIVARREWSSSGCQGTSLVQNTLESWDVTDGGAPKKVSELSFGKPNETVRGSVFDVDRAVAFAITARNVDPLYALSFADPTNLKVASAVDGLSGDMNVFRFIGDKKFLIGIGRDNSTTCTGFGTPSTGWATGVAVSVIDVQDLAKIRLVQRKCVAVKDAQWISSELNWNLDQAHKMIGMHSDGMVNAITVPVYYYKKTSEDSWWWYNYETAVGLMTWDLSKYDPAKDETQQSVLENYGTIVHPKGEVKRSIVFTHKGTPDRRMVLNLSDTHLSLVDIQDLASPVSQALVEVAPFQSELYRFTASGVEYLVEHVRPTQYYYYDYDAKQQNQSEFRVKKVGGKLEDGPVVASFKLGQVERVVKQGSALILFRRVFNEQAAKTGSWYAAWDSEIVTYDLSNPVTPKKLGALQIPGPVMPYYYFWCGLDAYWGGWWFDYSGNNFVVTDKGLAFLYWGYNYQTQTQISKLVFVDTSNLAAPKLTEYPLATAAGWTFFHLVPDVSDGSAFYLAYRTKVGTITIDGDVFSQFKYYAQRWSQTATGWAADFAVNVPGRLTRAWTVGGQQALLTYDHTYKKLPNPYNPQYSSWQYSFRLNLLREVKPWGAPVAELLDFHNFQSLYLKDLVVPKDGTKLFVNARQDWYSQALNKIPWSEVSDNLMVFDVSKLSLQLAYAAPIGTYSMQMMGTADNKLFINLPGDGVLVVDVTNPAAPIGQQFLRTLGYATHVEVVPAAGGGGTMYVAAGYFGVYQMDLKVASNIPVL